MDVAKTTKQHEIYKVRPSASSTENKCTVTINMCRGCGILFGCFCLFFVFLCGFCCFLNRASVGRCERSLIQDTLFRQYFHNRRFCFLVGTFHMGVEMQTTCNRARA
jgi:hypothetical protein